MSSLLFHLVRRYAQKRILEGVLPRDAALDAADAYSLPHAQGLELADLLEAEPSAGGTLAGAESAGRGAVSGTRASARGPSSAAATEVGSLSGSNPDPGQLWDSAPASAAHPLRDLAAGLARAEMPPNADLALPRKDSRPDEQQQVDALRDMDLYRLKRESR